MNEKSTYKFNCANFHSKRSDYLDTKKCSFDIESVDYDSVKAGAMAHLMQRKPKEIAEHHYQDCPNLNVEADVDDYLINYGTISE
ncbi:MAG: hypothetical protein IAE90_11260 [Ignavibacteria bacterium]|nr:hypothetical protein [Ignavibacteria bacterium]